MIYLKWALLAVSNLFLKYLIAWPLTPLIVLFANEAGFLPDWLYWFSTPDNSLHGDNGWRTVSRPFLLQTNRFKRYLNNCFWLWRNSLYGFNQRFLSVSFQPEDYLVDSSVDKITNGPQGKSGLSFSKIIRDKPVLSTAEGQTIAWQFYYVRQFKHWPHKCIRILLGYKLFQFNPFRHGSVSLALSAWVNKFTP